MTLLEATTALIASIRRDNNEEGGLLSRETFRLAAEVDRLNEAAKGWKLESDPEAEVRIYTSTWPL